MNRQYFEWKSLQLMLTALRNDPKLFKWDGINKEDELTAIGTRMTRAERLRLMQIFPKKDSNDKSLRDKDDFVYDPNEVSREMRAYLTEHSATAIKGLIPFVEKIVHKLPKVKRAPFHLRLLDLKKSFHLSDRECELLTLTFMMGNEIGLFKKAFSDSDFYYTQSFLNAHRQNRVRSVFGQAVGPPLDRQDVK
ncbi:MAG: hypothetical protein EOP04_05060 [Proteobacteria bacterium]|nr:MAG: hypothetical protein EOP04_05060 [Pseudomonadota bacterium]